MLLQCEICQNISMEIVKVPCGFHWEYENKELTFIMYTDERVYRDICLECLFKK